RSDIAEKAFHTLEPTAGLGRMRGVALKRATEFFEHFTLALAQVDRRFYRHSAQQVACRTTTHRRHTLAAPAELLAGLSPFGDVQLDPAIQGRHFQLAAQRRVGEADRHLAIQMLAVALEDRVLTHVDHHVQITRRATLGTGLAFAGQANAVARVDACGHLHGKRLLFFDAALAVAAATGIGNHLAAAMAARAGLLHGEEALLHTHLTDATTGGTGDGAG